MIYVRLFYIFAKLGLFTYGGGYAIIALLLGILEQYGWITSAEFSNLVAISQITPGPIAINSATFVGYKVAGVLGSAVAGAISLGAGCASLAPHGGIWILPIPNVITNLPMYVLALVAGSIVTCLSVALLKRKNNYED